MHPGQISFSVLPFVPANALLPRDAERDSAQLERSRSRGVLDFELTPTQRNRYFSDYALALEQDAVEQGILPLTQSIFKCGGYPQFSCEGHPESEGLSASAYVCFWSPPENVLHWARLMLCVQDFGWIKVRTDEDESRTATLGSAFTGQPGKFFTIYTSVRKQWRPSLPAVKTQELKQLFKIAHEDLASKLLQAAF